MASSFAMGSALLAWLALARLVVARGLHVWRRLSVGRLLGLGRPELRLDGLGDRVELRDLDGRKLLAAHVASDRGGDALHGRERVAGLERLAALVKELHLLGRRRAV